MFGKITIIILLSQILYLFKTFVFSSSGRRPDELLPWRCVRRPSVCPQFGKIAISPRVLIGFYSNVYTMFTRWRHLSYLRFHGRLIFKSRFAHSNSPKPFGGFNSSHTLSFTFTTFMALVYMLSIP